MWRVGGILGAMVVALAAAAPARAAAPTCDGFKAAMARESGDLKADFVRPLVVSRGAGSGLDSFDLVTPARLDGVLRCKGDVFVQFEVKIATPAGDELLERFAQAQRAASVAALGWTAARAEHDVREMAAEAADYLRASEERGDVSVSGKVEAHEPGGMDLGLIWTRSERSFILIRGE